MVEEEGEGSIGKENDSEGEDKDDDDSIAVDPVLFPQS